MTEAAPMLVARLAQENRIQGIISLGGGGGPAIGTAAMRALPIGFPKVMVSTLASGNTATYVGAKDIVMMPSVVDVAGLNRVSREILARAAGAICGMVEADWPKAQDRPVIVASQFGNTTRCIEQARPLLEQAGYEVLVFAAVGTGGRTMESLIESGMVAGVLDITTTEWADELVGGVLSAGPHRLEAAARCWGPGHCHTWLPRHGQLRSAGFRAREVCGSAVLRPQSAGDPDADEYGGMCGVGSDPGRKTQCFNRTGDGAVAVAPRHQRHQRAGPTFHDPAADAALFSTLKQGLRRDIPVFELEFNINDPAFAAACVEALLKAIREGGTAANKPT